MYVCINLSLINMQISTSKPKYFRYISFPSAIILVLAMLPVTPFVLLAQAPQGTNSANYVFSTIAPGTSGTSNSFSKDLNGTVYSMGTGVTTLIAAGKQNTNSSAYLAQCFTLDASCRYNPIGFDFYFMGMRATEFIVNSQGIIGFPKTPTSSEYEGVNGGFTRIGEGIPSDGNETRISAFTGCYARTYPNTGKVSYKTIGAAPLRTLVIEWKDIDYNNNTAGTTSFLSGFQVKLYESTNKIEYVYDRMNVRYNGTFQAGFSYGLADGQFATIKSLSNPTLEINTKAPANVTSFSTNPLSTLNSAGGDGFRRQILFDPVSGTTNLPPTDLVVVNGSNSVSLAWTDAPNEIGYDIYWSLKPEVPLDGTSGYMTADKDKEDAVIGDRPVPVSGTTTSGSKTITFGSVPVSNVWIGATISGLGIPPGSTITAINYQTNSITISNNATNSGNVSLTTGINPSVPLYYKVFARREALSDAAKPGTPTSLDAMRNNDFRILWSGRHGILTDNKENTGNPYMFDLFAVDGRQIISRKLNMGETIQLPENEKGIYFVRITDNSGHLFNQKIYLP